MKLQTTAIILAASTAHAGGLSDPIVQPPIVQNAAQGSAFAGAYVGLTFGRTEAVTDTPDVYVYECAAGTSHSRHSNNKCVVDQAAWENSPEIAALERNDRPWGQYETQYSYIQPNYHGVWLGGADSFTYTTTTLQGEPAVSKPTTTTLIDTITEMVAEESAVGAFAGYRVDVGPALIGAEVGSDGTMTTIEAQAGLPMGNVLAYGFAGVGNYDSESGTTYGGGVDVMVTDKIMIGGKMTVGEFGATETQTAGLRVAFAF